MKKMDDSFAIHTTSEPYKPPRPRNAAYGVKTVHTVNTSRLTRGILICELLVSVLCTSEFWKVEEKIFMVLILAVLSILGAK